MPRSCPSRLHIFLFSLVCFCACTAPLAHATKSREKPKDVILSLEDQWRTATLASDASEIDKLLSDDYVGISWNGQVSTKAMQLDRLRSRNFMLSRLDLSDVKVKVVGPIAIVTSTAEIEGVNDGNPVHGTFRYTRIYQRLISGNWKITNFEATRVPAPGEHGNNHHARNMTP